jgi:sporulation protein YunB
MKKWARRRGGNPQARKLLLLAVAAVFIFISFRGFYRFDRAILPLVLEAAELQMRTEINNVINNVVHEIIVANRVTAGDFIIQGPENAIVVNTVLVNEICNAAAMAISHYLANMPVERVRVPMGMATGLDTLAQVGPRFSFNLAPIGNALVDYESRFTAVGINQVHFSVALIIDATVRIINPHQSSEITVSRQISLVDTVISGVVPDTYFQMDNPMLNIGN